MASWHAQIADPTIADSILDRLVQNAHPNELKGGIGYGVVRHVLALGPPVRWPMLIPQPRLLA